MAYAKIKNNKIQQVAPRPKWLDDEGNPVSDEVLAQHGWYPVIDEQPEYDAMTQWVERQPHEEWTLETDKVHVAYTVHDRSFEELKTAKSAAVDAKLNSLLTGGYSHDFGEPHGVHILQTRDIEDRTNWLTSQASYSSMVAAGQGETEGAEFRTADNTNIVTSFTDGLAILLAMAAWGAACYSASWTLKDAIEAAEDQADLDAIDIDAGWPQ